MTTVADALAVLVDVPQRLASLLSRQLPDRPKTAIQADAMADERTCEAPPGRTLIAIADALRRVDSRATWDALPAQIRRLAPWALWTGEPPPIRQRGVLGCCRDEAIGARGTARIRSLIGVYLAEFRTNRPESGSSVM